MTVPVITSFYLSVLVLLLAWANWRAWNFARELRVPWMHRPEFTGDSLYAVILLLTAELLGASMGWLHLCGVLLVGARTIHIRTQVRQLGKWSGQSVPGSITTWVIMMLLVLTNAVLVLTPIAGIKRSLTSF